MGLTPDQGISLVRLREQGLSNISPTDVFCPQGIVRFQDIKNLLKVISNAIRTDKHQVKRIKDYIERGKFINEGEYIQLLEMKRGPLPGKSLADAVSNFLDEWHPIKNGNLTTKDFSPRSNFMIWWKCKMNHEWKSTIGNRTAGNGCPYCAGKMVNSENCLAVTNPKLSLSWHPKRNGDLSPQTVTRSCAKKVWWLCQKNHEWQATIALRNIGTGCPYCSGKKVDKSNSLLTLNPALSKEWHPTKNGDLTPADFTVGSSTNIWWLCAKGHEWLSLISNRRRGTTCPYCVGRKVSATNCLITVNPKLAQEWHSSKNGSLTPNDVTANSGKKVWWRCSHGHEWNATVDQRNGKGRGCPYCSHQRVNAENSLKIVNPTLAREWHPSKNGNLVPSEVFPKSGKKVWWICKREHEWQAVVRHRANGTGCPYCSGKRKLNVPARMSVV